uniref:Roadblock/LC7 family protein n=1 Tax=uncultured marine thaumarchaeote KM3_12_B11 TaxID=1455997 RepID=A0A075G9S6_9ARCH|nr:hypothetical protein [uncultured marine thaumarchaeote KM3_12_B11]
MNYEELCESVKKADLKIRFVGVINSKGRLVAGGMVSKIKPLEDEKKDEMLFMELVLRVRMRKEFNLDLGPVKFALSYREKVIIMSFPIKNDILMVSMESKAEFEKIAFKILKIVESI